jgi:transcriptional regulator with GAF, ATPase, and Fis domain
MTAVTLAQPGAGARRVFEIDRCGLLVLNGPREGEEVIIDRDCFRIGRSPDNDLSFADVKVSREHCEIVKDARGAYLLRVLASTNPTYLDSVDIGVGEVYLHADAVITLGEVKLKVQRFAERVLPSERDSFGDLCGRQPAMRLIFGLLERLAPSNATLLIGGETGTGKDLLARAVHAASLRAKGPFEVVDCGAVVGTLIESELFGHEKGAFTGALETRKGAFERAHKGTLFLDEIGELPMEVQPKLLRAIESRKIRRVSGQREIEVDIRIVAATHRDLKLEVDRGRFRQDLYFRLAVVPLDLPPLRERRDDIPLIATQLLKRLASESGADNAALELSSADLQALSAHDWPGNVRELRNVLERSALLARAGGEGVLHVLGLPANQAAPSALQTPATAFDPNRSYRQTREVWENEFERNYVSWLLARHAGNVSSAARAADMDRKYLHKLAKKHGLRGD